ncbi:hypothetical protein Xvie_03802 [Xenorhabdus vietnamensis]|uniref:Uncharacterized protein n=1 Tax=Xenorhabdus vietnamensis TaxID=351656 RepID=A0A1Y2SA13_9GAMM|nr:hypothetical protein [Xenorhabdus vietnamensis]OTA14341.1 hypothetical protein Xvie_03802 [Xenorhabdus vietnamensis]
MFKKLLTVGALAASISLTIGTASAQVQPKCPDQKVHQAGNEYIRQVVNPYNNFANVFTRYEPDVGKNIKWYFQGPSFSCTYNGTLAFVAQYRGVAS